MSGTPEGFVVQEPQPWWGTAEDRGLHIVLWQPEIPGNTGNIGRLCAGANIWLHLVEPLGFALDNKYLRRAGLDYWPHVRLCVHPDLGSCLSRFPVERVHLFSKKATRVYTEIDYEPGSVFVFGRETTGFDDALMDTYRDQLLRIPITDRVRSLNLSNACAIVVYEALRQLAWTPLEAG